jgi:hypothetical protein
MPDRDAYEILREKLAALEAEHRDALRRIPDHPDPGLQHLADLIDTLRARITPAS